MLGISEAANVLIHHKHVSEHMLRLQLLTGRLDDEGGLLRLLHFLQSNVKGWTDHAIVQVNFQAPWRRLLKGLLLSLHFQPVVHCTEQTMYFHLSASA